MNTATVVFNSGKGYWFADADTTHDRIYIHQKDVVRKRFLKVDDRIQYDLAPSLTQPGEERAVHVKVIGHVIAIQRGENMVRP